VLVEKGVVSAEELERRTDFFTARPDAPASDAVRNPPPAPARSFRWMAEPSERPATAPPRFAPGDAVVTRNIHPRGHTRLPRYTRGRRGVIHALHGTHVFPDTHAHGEGEQPQALYSVRFDAREMFGEAAEANHTIYIDLWEPYLEPGEARG
jgi:nitrile hydratase